MKKFGLIGRRLGHSWSQRWFEELFTSLGLADYSYRLYELPSVEGLKEWAQRERLLGFNVTVPYKQAVIPQLDALDADAEAIGAVNCVTVEEDRLVGHNTDAPAFRQTLESHTLPKQAYILGTGGAARAVAYALQQLDIPFSFVSREPNLHSGAISYDQLYTLSPTPSTLIINATPVGMYPEVDNTPLNLSAFHTSLASFLFYDLIYNPSPTLLMRQAAERGAHVKDGLEMLQRQANLSWEFFRACTHE